MRPVKRHPKRWSTRVGDRSDRLLWKNSVLVVTSVLAFGTPIPLVRAQHQSDVDPLTSQFVIDDADPERSVPTAEQAMRKPLDMGYQLMQLTERAEAAAKRGDHLQAAKYWAAVAKAVPDRSLPYSKMCAEYEAASDYVSAEKHCREALGRPGVTLEDNLRFARVVTERPGGPLLQRETVDVISVANHLEKELGPKEGAVLASRIRCSLALRTGDISALRRYSAELERLAPQDPQTFVFAWSLAMHDGDYGRAQGIIDRAKNTHAPAEAILRMTARLEVDKERNAPSWRRALRAVVSPRGLVGMGTALVFGAIALLFESHKRRRLRAP